MSSLKRKPKIEVIIEAKDGLLWGIVENKGNFVPTPYGKTKDEVISNLKELITDYQQNEGKKDRFWSKVNVDNMAVELYYDLQAFFKEFNELKNFLNCKKGAVKSKSFTAIRNGE